MKLQLQFFGGRGSSAGGASISAGQVLNLPSGSRISVQHFSSITGKPDGRSVEYVKNGAWWSSSGYGSFRNNSSGINSLNSKNGVVPKIKRIK